MSENKKRRKKDIILNILLVIFFLVAVGCAGYLGHYYYVSSRTQKNFKELKNLMTEDDSQGDSTQETASADDEPKVMLKKFEKLYEQNSDIAGWITIDGTNIDYPVMFTPEDGDYYLYLNFDEEWELPGTPFIDDRCRVFDNRTTNLLIYGHNIQSGIMFHQLLNYTDEDFYKEHKYIQFDTLYEEATYEIVAAFKTQIYAESDTEHYHYDNFIDVDNEKDFDEYISFAKGCMEYNIDTTASYGDELITLSTCSHHVTDGRFVVVAKKIEE
jgi:sortase B